MLEQIRAQKKLFSNSKNKLKANAPISYHTKQGTKIKELAEQVQENQLEF